MGRDGAAVVVTCEHAGSRVPARYRALFADAGEVLASHHGYDPGAQALARALAKRLGVEAIVYPFTRLLIDTNRSEHHRGLYSRFTQHLSNGERQRLLRDYYRPHRRRVEAAVERGRRARGRVVHLAAHSFTPVLDGARRNADVGLLYDPGRRPERAFSHALGRCIREFAPELRVRFNYPYRGAADGLTTALRRRWSARQYIGVEIELNQALLDDRDRARNLVARIADAVADVSRR